MLERIKKYFDYVIQDKNCIVALDKLGVFFFVETDNPTLAKAKCNTVFSSLELNKDEYTICAIGKGSSTSEVLAFSETEFETVLFEMLHRSKVNLSDSYLEEISLCWGLKLEDVKTYKTVRQLEQSELEIELKKLRAFYNFGDELSDEKIRLVVQYGKEAIVGLAPNVAIEVNWVLEQGCLREDGYSQETANKIKRQKLVVASWLLIDILATLLQVNLWIVMVLIIVTLIYGYRVKGSISSDLYTMLCVAMLMLIFINLDEPILSIIENHFFNTNLL